MNDNEKNIKIAELCGYTWMTKHGSLTTHHFAHYKPEDISSLLAHGFILGRDGSAAEIDTYGLDQVPDYVEDLNAMHAAESLLYGTPLIGEYEMHLLRRATNISPFCATAAERADAFLLTHNVPI